MHCTPTRRLDPMPKFAYNVLAFFLSLGFAAVVVVAFGLPSKAEGVTKAKPRVAASRTATPAPAAAPAEPAAVTNWTGFHVGAFLGAAVSSSEVAGIVTLSSNGALGGLAAGYDYQFPGTPFVIGVATDYGWRDLNASLGPTSVDLKGAWSATARAGIAFDKLLVYGRGGWTQAQASTSLAIPDKFDGWLMGAGVEALVSSALSVGMEYRAEFYRSEAIAPGVGIEPSGHELMFTSRWRFNSPLR